tara:strand:- start:111 stop:293 length:183 start_codon:yes stop_codon:yes gene_type:complete
MQFGKNTSSGATNTKGIIIKSILGLLLLFAIVFFISNIDFPAPKKEIKKTIPNENFKVIK